MEEIYQWIKSEAKFCNATHRFLHELITRLNANGMAILRAVINIRTLHPEVGAITYQWYNEDLFLPAPSAVILRHEQFPFPNAKVVMNIVKRSTFDSVAYKTSPFHSVRFEKKHIFDKLFLTESKDRYPIYEDLRTLGATCYYARELKFSDGERNVMTFASAYPGGFTQQQLDFLDSIFSYIASYVEIFSQRRLMQTLLELYLGEQTGRQVLRGQIQRGDVQKIQSVIWFSDLRGFSTLSQKHEADIIGILNRYFDTVAESLQQYGGEILKFIGDAILAIFPIEKDAETAAKAAFEAAVLANLQLKQVNDKHKQEGLPAIKHGIGLHIGEILYGNIGSRDRLDFTVIGNAVNIASRVESLCVKLGETILLSSELATHLPGKVQLLGEYDLKGIEEKQRVYVPKA
ncbi:MAG: adenylate/guanylate cyclase domain-containing protein [Spirochaetota bacterium]